MPYRVMVGGISIECDSIEEALTLAQGVVGAALEHTTSRAPKPVALPGASRWTEARMKEFFGLLKGNQRRLVDELLDHPEGRTDDQLCTTFGLNDGRKLGGIFTGLWKNAKKVGADPNDVYDKQRVTIGNERGFEYTLTQSFRMIAEKVRPTVKK